MTVIPRLAGMPNRDPLKPRPLMEPIATFAASKASALGKAMALAAVTRGLQTLLVVAARGKSGDSNCLLYGAEGTPHHCLWRCPGLCDERNKCPCDLQHLAGA